MTRLAPYLAHNDRFARDYVPVPLGLPTAKTIVLTCLDHRIDPAAVLGLRPGDAPVIRNAGGRVTPSVLTDLRYLAFLATAVFEAKGPLFEVAVLHHTQCGTGFLADPHFLRQAARATGVEESVLAGTEVGDPYRTVREDVEQLRAAALEGVSLSAHVLALETGRVTTVLDAGGTGVGAGADVIV